MLSDTAGILRGRITMLSSRLQFHHTLQVKFQSSWGNPRNDCETFIALLAVQSSHCCHPSEDVELIELAFLPVPCAVCKEQFLPRWRSCYENNLAITSAVRLRF